MRAMLRSVVPAAASLLAAGFLLAGCLATLPDPRCPEPAEIPPSSLLSCQVAVEVAAASLPAPRPDITALEFRYGSICPPNARCAAPTGDAGTVIVTFADGIQQSILVRVAGDRVMAEPPVAYPPTS